VEHLWRRTGLPLIEQAVQREFSGLKLGGPSGKGPLFRLRAVHLDRRFFDRRFAELAGAAVRTAGGVRSAKVLLWLVRGWLASIPLRIAA